MAEWIFEDGNMVQQRNNYCPAKLDTLGTIAKGS
jgi:hypothetical protein